MKRGFTPAQRASGILTTFSRGDYTLAVARIRETPDFDRAKVIQIVAAALPADEYLILQRYAKDLLK